MIIILFKSLGKRTSIGSYYDEKSLTKCYCPRPHWSPVPVGSPRWPPHSNSEFCSVGLNASEIVRIGRTSNT